MKTILWMALACGLSGCDGKTGGTGGGDDSSGGRDTGDSDATCNTDNEVCAPGTCGGEGPDMLPGADCLKCHVGEGDDDRRDAESFGPLFTAAGTVFSDADGSAAVAGATVRISDAAGKQVELTTSSSGNFYTSQPLTPPLTAEVEVDGNVLSMSTEPTTGACNSCHRCGGGAGGKLVGR